MSKTYDIWYYCENCGRNFPVQLNFGVPADFGISCPRCGCNKSHSMPDYRPKRSVVRR